MAAPGCARPVGLAYWGATGHRARRTRRRAPTTTAKGSHVQIINLTPHPVTLVTTGGDEVVVPPEAAPVRIPATTTPAGEINGIPLVTEQLGDANSVLPAPQPGVVYVVSRPVA